jgi:hypothetical protein
MVINANHKAERYHGNDYNKYKTHIVLQSLFNKLENHLAALYGNFYNNLCIICNMHAEAWRTLAIMLAVLLVTITGWYLTKRRICCDHFVIYCASQSQL